MAVNRKASANVQKKIQKTKFSYAKLHFFAFTACDNRLATVNLNLEQTFYHMIISPLHIQPLTRPEICLQFLG